jgi:hypothetical protein
MCVMVEVLEEIVSVQMTQVSSGCFGPRPPRQVLGSGLVVEGMILEIRILLVDYRVSGSG